MTPRHPVPRRYWALWLPLLALGLLVFYVILTPVWMAIRLAAWLADGERRSERTVR